MNKIREITKKFNGLVDNIDDVYYQELDMERKDLIKLNVLTKSHMISDIKSFVLEKEYPTIIDYIKKYGIYLDIPCRKMLANYGNKFSYVYYKEKESNGYFEEFTKMYFEELYEIYQDLKKKKALRFIAEIRTLKALLILSP